LPTPYSTMPADLAAAAHLDHLVGEVRTSVRAGSARFQTSWAR
jgi:hypothetical protein